MNRAQGFIQAVLAWSRYWCLTDSCNGRQGQRLGFCCQVIRGMNALHKHSPHVWQGCLALPDSADRLSRAPAGYSELPAVRPCG